MSFLSRRREDETVAQVTAALSIDGQPSTAQLYQSSGAKTDHRTSGRPRLRGRSSVANAGGARKSLTARPNDRNLSQNCRNSKRPQRWRDCTGKSHRLDLCGRGSPCLQEPFPGFSEKYFSNLPVSRSNCSASAGGVPLTVMLGQT